MKLAFTGTHVTGKTTLLHAYDKYYQALSNKQDKKFGYITGIARQIIKRGFPLNKDGNIDSYVNYINDQLEAEKEMNGFDYFISDRTLLSPLAYALTNRSLPRPYIPDYFINMMENIWLLEKDRYDLYIYFPVEFPMSEKDDIHPPDEEYRVQVDIKMRELLERHDIPHIHMTGSPEERLSKLIRIFAGDFNV